MLTLDFFCPPEALLVSKWADVVCGARALGAELDGEERELLQSITAMLRQEEGAEPDGGGRPLAARLLRYCAAFYEDTWVWGGESEHFVTDFSSLPLSLTNLTINSSWQFHVVTLLNHTQCSRAPDGGRPPQAGGGLRRCLAVQGRSLIAGPSEVGWMGGSGA